MDLSTTDLYDSHEAMLTEEVLVSTTSWHH